MGSAAGWSLGWGLFRIFKDERYIPGVTAVVFAAALIGLLLLSQDRGKGRSTPTEEEEKR